jgi:hypothetical protein
MQKGESIAPVWKWIQGEEAYPSFLTSVRQ